MTGALGGGYSRDVDRPPAEVMNSLADLDITKEPGSPGTDPSLAGGVTPMFVLERGADTMTWKVMSGDKVATIMTAKFAPIGDGARTRVTATVDRGDAPDDLVSPAFRSTGVTLGLFSLALETELDELALPAGGSPAKCDAIIKSFEDEGLARLESGGGASRRGFGEGAQAIMQVNAQAMKLRAAGCDINGNSGEFRPVSQRMSAAPAASGGEPHGPGKPTTDLSQYSN